MELIVCVTERVGKELAGWVEVTRIVWGPAFVDPPFLLPSGCALRTDVIIRVVGGDSVV